MAARYSFDTSSFLNGRRDLLPPEVFVTLWNKIEQMIGDGDIRAVDVVRDELGRRDDEVNAWARLREGLFVELDVGIQAATKEILALHPKLMGRGGGRNAADPFVIGFGRLVGATVVTEEKPSGRLDKPRIPDVCDALGVPWVNLVGFVRTQAWRF